MENRNKYCADFEAGAFPKADFIIDKAMYFIDESTEFITCHLFGRRYHDSLTSLRGDFF
ncbi:hypothetical protein WIW50_17940 [Flavobacteriaceae bacterium 3-367]|uniref:hypothetical protein n=1 Tax=Eudoraea algarum TaxID=3417568 RepID=UPI003284A2CE